MSDQPQPPQPPPAAAKSPGPAADRRPGETETAPNPNLLTPEEQMERFAEELKQNDWGHQPC